MKTTLKMLIAPTLLALVILNAQLSIVRAQGTTAFTYQGQLRDNGIYANGSYGMIFKLYDSANGGDQLGSAITNIVTLANGLFTVNLDFSTNFDGNARWLDITVSNGVDTQELSPRVQVLPAPYALFANTASNLMGGVAVGTFVGNGGGLTNVTAMPQMQVFNTPGTFTFTVPTNVTTITVELWGGGGGGGDGNDQNLYDQGGGSGGGGGGYGKGIFSVTPGANYSVVVGAGGNPDSSGQTSSFSSLISASGGNAGGAGASGAAFGPIGGTGGSSSATVNITGSTGESASQEGGDGGNAGCGGSGGRGDQGEGNGAEGGQNPGGGGGGGAMVNENTENSDPGAAGGNGEVIIHY